MKIVSSQIDGPIGSNVEDQAAGRWNSTPALPWATAAMGRLKDAFTYLQAGSKPKALEIAQSADLRQMNQRGQSLMFAAAGRPLNKGSAELLCQILQKRGLAVDALDGHHQTALFAAAREGNEICADWLIAQGCAVDHADFRGETPLCIAFRNSQMGMVMKLLKHGASLGVKDMYGGRQPTFFCRPYFPQSLCGEAQRTAWDHEFSKEAKTWASRRGAPVEAVQRGLILAVHRPQCDDPMGISRWGRSTRDNSRERVQRSWQRMMTSWSLFHPQKQQPGSVFWSGNFLWIMRIACEGTPCTLPWHLMSGQTFLESLWTRLTLTNQFTIYWKSGQRPRPSFAVLKTFQHSKRGPGSLTPLGSGCIRGYLRMSYGVGETVTLQHLKVQREHQRRGIATLMLEGGLRLAREHHEWSFKQISLKVFLRNQKALAFYERMGFQHSRPLPKRPRSALAEWSLMKKEIWGMGWSLGAHHHFEKMYFSIV